MLVLRTFRHESGLAGLPNIGADLKGIVNRVRLHLRRFRSWLTNAGIGSSPKVALFATLVRIAFLLASTGSSAFPCPVSGCKFSQTFLRSARCSPRKASTTAGGSFLPPPARAQPFPCSILFHHWWKRIPPPPRPGPRSPLRHDPARMGSTVGMPKCEISHIIAPLPRMGSTLRCITSRSSSTIAATPRSPTAASG